MRESPQWAQSTRPGWNSSTQAVLCGSCSLVKRVSRMAVWASLMIVPSSCCGDSSAGAKTSNVWRALKTTCSAAIAPPVWPPMPSASTAIIRPLRPGWGIRLTRSCCSLRSPICCAAQVSTEKAMGENHHLCSGRL